MFLILFINFISLLAQNNIDKIPYQHLQEYVVNVVCNLSAIDVDDSATDKLFIEQFLEEIKNKKIGSILDSLIKPDLDRQRIYEFILNEFSMFVGKQSYDLAYSSGISHKNSEGLKNQVLDLLKVHLQDHQYFDLYNHYGLLRDFKGQRLVNLVKKFLAS